MTYTLASTCTGFGGLDLAVEAVFGLARHLWHAEFNADKARILAAHWPEVPNLGDLTTVDWASVERPDVLTAGFPCQDISAAGRRAGMSAGTRSGVWSHIADAIAGLRPRLVVIENVSALLSTPANRTVDGTDRDMEPGPAVLGNGASRPVLRALGAVCGDLADIGFDAEWATVAASDVGACHRRRRVFIVAWPADSEGVGFWHRRAQSFAGVASAAVAGGVGGDGVSLFPTPAARLGDNRGAPSASLAADRFASGRRNLDDAVALLPTPMAADGGWGRGSSAGYGLRNVSRQIGREVLLPTPTARDGDGRGEGSPEYWANRHGRENGQGAPLGAVVNLLPTPRATDGTKGGPNQRGSSGDLMLPSAVMDLLPTPVTTDAKGARNATANRSADKIGVNNNGWTLSDVAYADRWGRYTAAIARWEQVMGRPAPEPTEPGSKGQPRLSPRFVEWMQRLPDGWVTDHVGRNPALHALGDGVVWQQGALALRLLLSAAVRPVGVAA